jgi:hypothetical protein
MIRTMGAAALLALASVMPTQPVAAQDILGGAILGGAAGALIGGAATGRAGGAAVGAAIGAGVGATIAAEGQRRRSGYYWYRNRCYVQDQYGNWYRVASHYC